MNGLEWVSICENVRFTPIIGERDFILDGQSRGKYLQR